MSIEYRRRFNMADGLIVTAATAATLARHSNRKGNQCVMANGQETGTETLRIVIARHSAPQ